MIVDGLTMAILVDDGFERSDLVVPRKALDAAALLAERAGRARRSA